MVLPRHLSLDDLEAAAARSLPPNTWDFYRSGARDGSTLRANRLAWSTWGFLPGILADIDAVATATSVLGEPIALPLLVAPMSAQSLAHPDGELAVSRALAGAGLINIVSSGTTTALADVAAIPRGRFWAQHYALEDPEADDRVIAAAREAGAGAIVLTVDAPTRTPPRAHPRGGFIEPPGLRYAIADALLPIRTRLDWAYVDRLRDEAGLPLVVKGIMRPDDARRAADHGVAAIVVSNHGGRILDGALATADALEAVAEAVADRIEVYVDGGIRRGADILRALALGARAVLVGRPILWGLAYAGEDGVAHVLETLRRELEIDAALAGVSDVQAVPRDLLVRLACPECGVR